MLVVFITKSWLGYLNLIMILASASYHIWVYMEFFKEKSLFGFLKALGSYILGIILFFAFTMILGFIIGIIIMTIN
jgi:hypothetical protein